MSCNYFFEDDLYHGQLGEYKVIFEDRQKDLTIAMETFLPGVGQLIKGLAKADLNLVETFKNSKLLEISVRFLDFHLEDWGRSTSRFDKS